MNSMFCLHQNRYQQQCLNQQQQQQQLLKNLLVNQFQRKKNTIAFFKPMGGIMYSFLSNTFPFNFVTQSCSRLFFSNCSSLLACCQRILFDNCDHFCSACGGSSVHLLCLRRGGRQQTICASFATLQFEQQFCVVAQREQRRFAASRQQIGSLCSQTIAFATRFVGRNI